MYASKLTRGSDIVMDCGLSADDLVGRTLEKFLQSPNGLGWREAKGSLAAFLATVLKNDFIDHLRREKKVLRPDPDAEERPQQTASQPGLIEELALKELQGRLLSLIRGREDEHELEEFILAASMTTGEGKVNQQIADLLGVDEGEVINRRKRVWRVAGMKKLREEFTHERKRN